VTIHPYAPGVDENYGGTFIDETMDLTGRNWLGCVFMNCDLTLREPQRVSGSCFEMCIMRGDAWKAEFGADFPCKPLLEEVR
jgi:hypothetical protein